MHAILPLISSNWHSSGQRDPTFSPWTSPVLHASAQLHLQQSFANQPSEEIVSSCLHFSSLVTTTSQPHLAGLKMRHLFGQRRLRNRAERERRLCVHDFSPHKQQDSQYLHQKLSYPFCQPTSAHSSRTRPEKGVTVAVCHAMKVLPHWLEALEAVKIKHVSGDSEFKSFPTQKVCNPLTCLTNLLQSSLNAHEERSMYTDSLQSFPRDEVLRDYALSIKPYEAEASRLWHQPWL